MLYLLSHHWNVSHPGFALASGHVQFQTGGWLHELIVCFFVTGDVCQTLHHLPHFQSLFWSFVAKAAQVCHDLSSFHMFHRTFRISTFHLITQFLSKPLGHPHCHMLWTSRLIWRSHFLSKEIVRWIWRKQTFDLRFRGGCCESTVRLNCHEITNIEVWIMSILYQNKLRQTLKGSDVRWYRSDN